MKPTPGRRKSDVRTQRLLYLSIALTLASSMYSIYIGSRAIKAMDETSNFAKDAYYLGKKIGKAPDYTPGPEQE